MTIQSVTIDLPEELVHQLVQAARASKRTLSDVVRERLQSDTPALPALPADVEHELAVYPALADDLLWQVAKTAMAPAEQAELAELNQLAQARQLTAREQRRQAALLDHYQRMMVRRAEATAQLQRRGHNVSGLFVAPIGS